MVLDAGKMIRISGRRWHFTRVFNAEKPSPTGVLAAVRNTVPMRVENGTSGQNRRINGQNEALHRSISGPNRISPRTCLAVFEYSSAPACRIWYTVQGCFAPACLSHHDPLLVDQERLLRREWCVVRSQQATQPIT